MQKWTRLFVAVWAASAVVACEGPPPTERCNNDVDCPSASRCLDGLCTPTDVGPEGGPEPSAEPSPEPAPEPPLDAGPRDGGPTDGGPQDGGPEDGGTPEPLLYPQWPNVASLDFPPQAEAAVEAVVLPVAISLSPDILSDPSLRMTDAEGAPVAFERTSTTLWVRVPGLDPDSGARLNLYFGADAPAAGHRADPWADARGVWHLDTAAQDSSPLDNAGTTPGVLIEQGVIGGARQITRGNNPATTPETEGIRLPDGQPYIGNAAAISVAFWVRVDDLETSNVDREFVSIAGTSTSVYSRMLFTLDSGVSYRFRAAGVGQSPMIEPAATDVDLSQWTFLVGTADFAAREIAIFENGVEVARESMTHAETGAPLFAPTTYDELHPVAAFGSEDDGRADVMNGGLDEIRLLERALSPAAVATMYAYEVAGGALAVVGPVETRTPQAIVSDFVAIDDVAEVVANVPAVVDVRANDQSSLPVTVTATEVLSGEVDVSIRSDGRLRLEMPAPSLESEVEVTLTDGTPGGERSSRLSITSAEGEGDPLVCHAFAVHALPSQAFSLRLEELARVEDNGPLVLVDAEATVGSAITEPNAVHYSAPASALDIDFLRATVTDGVHTCTARVALHLDATLPPASEITLPFDVGLANAFSFPFAAANLDDTTTILFDGAHSDDSQHPIVTALPSGDFALQPNGVARDSVLFFAAQTIDGELHASTRAYIERVSWAPEVFSHRTRVVINDQFLDADLYNASTVVDLASLNASDRPRFEGIRIYAPGSRTLLPLQNEATVTPTQPAKVRTMIPVVRTEGPPNYFWIYFNHQDEEEPASSPSDVVWGPDVVGAWSFSRDLLDQTPNGFDATSTVPLTFTRAGASLADAPLNAVMLPPIDLAPPFTVEVYFEPINTWADPLETQAIVTRTSEDKARAVAVAWAGTDFVTDVVPPFSNALVARVGPSPGDSITAFRRGAVLPGDEAIYVSAAFAVQPPADNIALVTEAEVAPIEVEASGQAPRFPEGTEWVIGPSRRIGNETFSAACDCRIRSVRLRNGLMSRDRSAYQRRSDNRQLLTFGNVESP